MAVSADEQQSGEDLEDVEGRGGSERGLSDKTGTAVSQSEGSGVTQCPGWQAGCC